jgi:ankyrin repeat protein
MFIFLTYFLHDISLVRTVSFLDESCGADLRMKNGLGCTPLWIAAGYNRIECLEYLITRVSQRIEHNKGDVFGQYLFDANDSGDSPLRQLPEGM